MYLDVLKKNFKQKKGVVFLQNILLSIPRWKSVYFYTPCPWGWPNGLREQCREMESCAVSWKNPFICCQYACWWAICLFVNLCFTFSFSLFQTALKLKETFHSLNANHSFVFFLGLVLSNENSFFEDNKQTPSWIPMQCTLICLVALAINYASYYFNQFWGSFCFVLLLTEPNDESGANVDASVSVTA